MADMGILPIPQARSRRSDYRTADVGITDIRMPHISLLNPVFFLNMHTVRFPTRHAASVVCTAILE